MIISYRKKNTSNSFMLRQDKAYYSLNQYLMLGLLFRINLNNIYENYLYIN